MQTKYRYLIRGTVFVLAVILIFLIGNRFMQPVWLDWDNYNTTHGFYEEPENTIEVIFLGSSDVASGFTPMELYEYYGICAYNLGTEQQPVLASYYWLEEVYRLHPETLKTVIFDCTMMKRMSEKAFY